MTKPPIDKQNENWDLWDLKEGWLCARLQEQVSITERLQPGSHSLSLVNEFEEGLSTVWMRKGRPPNLAWSIIDLFPAISIFGGIVKTDEKVLIGFIWVKHSPNKRFSASSKIN